MPMRLVGRPKVWSRDWKLLALLPVTRF